jgi:hypothetical protein
VRAGDRKTKAFQRPVIGGKYLGCGDPGITRMSGAKLQISKRKNRKKIYAHECALFFSVYSCG